MSDIAALSIVVFGIAIITISACLMGIWKIWSIITVVILFFILSNIKSRGINDR